MERVSPAAEQLRQGANRMPHEPSALDRWLAAVQTALEPNAFELVWQRGVAMSVDELIDFVTV